MRLHFETKQLQAFVLLAGWSESTRLGLIARLRRGGVAAALISCDLLGARADTPYRVQIRRKCKYVNEIRLAPFNVQVARYTKEGVALLASRTSISARTGARAD